MRKLSGILAASIAILMSGNAAGAGPHLGKWEQVVGSSMEPQESGTIPLPRPFSGLFPRGREIG
jgi:hypothetical protein